MSPAHRMSCINDSSRYCSESNVSTVLKKQRNKKIIIAEDASEITNNGTIRNFLRETELCTIKEYKTSSEAERSGDTTHEENSAASKKQEYEESMQLYDEHANSSPRPHDDVHYMMKNIYGNLAFEEHATDVQHSEENPFEFRITKKPKLIKHSYSLDLSGVCHQNKKRKLSIESKLEALNQSKGFLKNTVVSKFFDHNPKLGQDNFKSYLCRFDKNGGEEDNL